MLIVASAPPRNRRVKGERKMPNKLTISIPSTPTSAPAHKFPGSAFGLNFSTPTAASPHPPHHWEPPKLSEQVLEKEHEANHEEEVKEEIVGETAGETVEQEERKDETLSSDSDSDSDTSTISQTTQGSKGYERRERKKKRKKVLIV